MIDFCGIELKIGDRVVYCKYNKTNASLYDAVVVGFTEKMVKIEYYNYSIRFATVCPEKLVIV